MSREIQEITAKELEQVYGGMDVGIGQAASTVTTVDDTSTLSSAILGKIVGTVISQLGKHRPA